MSPFRKPALVGSLLWLCIFGCDPMDVSSAGTITIDGSIDTVEFHSLCVVTMAETAFDPDVLYNEQTVTTSELKVSLAEISFPYDYETDSSIGVSESKPFRAVAWLDRASADTAFSDLTLDADEPYGVAEFSSLKCGGWSADEDRCGLTTGVDIVIDQIRSD